MLKKKLLVLLLSASMAMTMLAGCGSNTDKKEETKTETSKNDAAETKNDSKAEDKKAELEDGTYNVDFNTDSSMFHENPDYNNGKATLTVKDGEMTVHITLNSKNIVQLFLGTAEDAQKDGAKLIQPTTDTVEYTDGSPSEEVYGFDVPVEKLGEEFDLALIGTKGTWYDHKVSVSNPEAVQ